MLKEINGRKEIFSIASNIFSVKKDGDKIRNGFYEPFL